MYKKHTFILFLLLLVSLIAAYRPAAAQDGAPLVLRLSADGPVSPAMAEYLRRGIRLAERRGAELVVLELNTPGGSITTMQEMVQSILESDVPVVVGLSPGRLGADCSDSRRAGPDRPTANQGDRGDG